MKRTQSTSETEGTEGAAYDTKSSISGNLPSSGIAWFLLSCENK